MGKRVREKAVGRADQAQTSSLFLHRSAALVTRDRHRVTKPPSRVIFSLQPRPPNDHSSYMDTLCARVSNPHSSTWHRPSSGEPMASMVSLPSFFVISVNGYAPLNWLLDSTSLERAFGCTASVFSAHAACACSYTGFSPLNFMWWARAGAVTVSG